MIARRNALKLLGLLGAGPLVLSGCGGEKTESSVWGTGDDGFPPIKEADLNGLSVNEPLVQGLNQFGLELLRILPKGNQLISPISLGFCLGMAELGADGTTREEMRKVLHLSAKPDTTDPGWNTLGKFLKVEKPKRLVRLLNALFLQSGYPLTPDFQKEIKEWFQSKLQEVDFKGNTDQARKTINQWISQNTANTLGEVIPQSILTHLTRLVLVNVIQFKGEWEDAFEKSKTLALDFESEPDKKKSVPFMNRHSGKYSTRQNERIRSLEIPCKTGDRSVHILLPQKRHGLNEVLPLIKEKELEKLLFDPTRPEEIIVSIPKCKIESNLRLKEALSQLGMPTAFLPGNADFSRFNGKLESLSIETVIHKTQFIMDEEGARAVAATVIEFKKDSIRREPEPFIADQPFLIAITDKASKAILFLGRVNDPEAV